MGRSAVRTLVLAGMVGSVAGRAAGDDVTWRSSVEAGANFSKWHATEPDAFGRSTSDLYANLAGFYVGGSVSVPIWRLSVRPGLMFSRRGTDIPADPERVRVDYLAGFVLAEARPPVVLGVQPVILGGVEVDRFLHARSSQSPDSDNDDAFRHADVGLTVGVAVERGRIAAETAYTWGLRGVGRDAGGLYNRCLSVGLRVDVWRGRRTSG